MSIKKLSASVVFCVHLLLCQSSSLPLIDVIKNGLKNNQIKPSDQITLLVGLTGSGKTTLAKFLTGDRTNLVSVPFTDEYHFLQYRIEDLNDDKISKNTKIPKTLYPDQYVDSVNSEVIIDCPSFDDSRSDSDEIAIYVFLRKIFQWTKRARIIVVVDAADVRLGGSRTNFLNLLNHLEILLENYDECQQCVGMVVTKGKTKLGVHSEEDITTLAGFLKQVYNGLQASRVKRILSNLLNEDLIKGYRNIGVFRQPQEKGPLQRISAYSKEKFHLRIVVFSNLNYASTKNQDYSSKISKKNRPINMIFLQIKMKISKFFTNFTNELFSDYSNTLRPIAEYKDFHERLIAEAKLFDRTKLERIKSVQGQLKWFIDIATIQWPHANFVSAFNLTKVEDLVTDFLFLKETLNNPLVIQPLNISTIVSDVEMELDGWVKWSRFLLDTFDRLSQYDILSKKSSTNFTVLKNWGDFKNFAFGALKIVGPTSIRDKFELETSQQFALEDMLQIVQGETTFRDLTPNSDTCDLTMEGNFVLQSEVNKKSSVCGKKRLSALRMFAQFTVFLDVPFEAIGEELLVGIVAPNWQVVGRSTIILDGADAADYNASSSIGDGRAGMPGGPSGLFFGITQKIDNSKNLKISASGGAGGGGEQGKKGIDGHERFDGHAAYRFACNGDHYNYECKLDSEFYQHNFVNYEMEKQSCDRKFIGRCPYYFVSVKIVSGPEATSGFRGGKQGLGGLHSKSNQLIALDGVPEVKFVAAEGHPGKIGMGGDGGLGAFQNGYSNHLVQCKCGIMHVNGVRTCQDKGYHPGERGPSGKNGPSNSSGTQTRPKPTKKYDTYDFLSKYRLFTYNQMLNQQRTSITSSQRSFFNEIRSKPNVKNLINLTSLISEFIGVENLRRKQPNNIMWFDVYDSLLQAVEASHSVKSISETSNYKVIAHYLSAAILSRRLDLEYQTDNNLVVDTFLFLQEVARQIQEFTVLDRNQRINEIQSIYNQDILEKQREGEKFINQQFKDEMYRVQQKMDASIEKLLNEVKKLLSNLENDRTTLLKNLKTANMNLGLNIAFDVLKGFGVIASLVPEGGSFVKDLIDYGIDIGGKFTGPTGDAPTTKVPDILDRVENIEEELKQEFLAKILTLKRQLDTTDVKLPGEQSVIEEAKSILESSSVVNVDIYEVQIDVYYAIESSKQKFKVAKSAELHRLQATIFMTDTREIEAYNMLHRSTQMVTSKSRSYTDEVDQIEEQLEEVQAKIRKGAQYHQIVDRAMRSQLQNFAGLMKSLIAGSTESSSIGLEISRFKIKETFEDMRARINRFTVGFEANEDLKSCINVMEYLMNTAINVYDQIQKGNDQTNLGNLITNINKLGLKHFNTNDTSLDKSLEQLQYTLVSDTIRNQYTRAVNSFKQLVFPFAPLFLEDIHISDIPSTGEVGNDILKLMVKKLGTLTSKVNNLKLSIIQGYDDGIFTSTYKTFHVWNEVDYKDTIFELLNGKEITLKADVLNSFADAVKFFDIQLELTTEDANDRKLLNSMMMTKNIKLTHMGHSQFRCGAKYFTIFHQPQNIEYSFQSDDKGEPDTSNNVFKKIRTRDILLSPYTIWKFQLADMYKFRSYLDLSPLFGKIKLSLAGRAQFVKINNPICQKKSLESFYELDKITMENSQNIPLNT